LSILSATAVYAMGNPIGKSHPEQVQPESEEKGNQNTL
jgi:Na+-transporting methylmalonyl-CoA/oxaloacetate decarboxylase gamma subunit